MAWILVEVQNNSFSDTQQFRCLTVPDNKVLQPGKFGVKFYEQVFDFRSQAEEKRKPGQLSVFCTRISKEQLEIEAKDIENTVRIHKHLKSVNR